MGVICALGATIAAITMAKYTMYGKLLISYPISRCISTSAVVNGKRNFRKFQLFNKRGTKLFKEERMRNSNDPNYDMPPYDYGVRPIGYVNTKGKFVQVPEMVPELIVPDLTEFKLKPYVSYKVPDVIQSEFTAQDLFDAVYSKKVSEDFMNNKLDSNGNPMEPSEEEVLTPEEAEIRARKTGSCIF